MSSEQPLEGIAIVGIAGRFPGANNVLEFWRNLLAAEETISTLSDEQLRASGLDPEALYSGGSYIPRRGLLNKPAHFDAAFFGIHHASLKSWTRSSVSFSKNAGPRSMTPLATRPAIPVLLACLRECRTTRIGRTTWCIIPN